MPDKKISKRINDHLANERTFLAWIRTSIGIMGFGFVVVKFSLFIRQIAIMLGPKTELHLNQGYSGIVGITLVIIGAMTVVLAYIKYRKVSRQIEEESFTASSYGIAEGTLCMLIISVALCWYLIASL